MLRAAVVIDYQNVHLTARDVFGPGGHVHDFVIEPTQFARRAIAERNARQRAGYPHAQLVRVTAFRGLPHPDYEWEQSRRCQDQATRWRAEGADLQLRDLKYSFQRDARGGPATDINGRKIPVGRPVEKGIDVLCALACVRESRAQDVDVVILASRDTDLVPVLDEIHDLHASDRTTIASIETASWFNAEAKREGRYAGGSLRPTGARRIWNTNLDRSCCESSIDRFDYR